MDLARDGGETVQTFSSSFIVLAHSSDVTKPIWSFSFLMGTSFILNNFFQWYAAQKFSFFNASFPTGWFNRAVTVNDDFEMNFYYSHSLALSIKNLNSRSENLFKNRFLPVIRRLMLTTTACRGPVRFSLSLSVFCSKCINSSCKLSAPWQPLFGFHATYGRQ